MLCMFHFCVLLHISFAFRACVFLKLFMRHPPDLLSEHSIKFERWTVLQNQDAQGTCSQPFQEEVGQDQIVPRGGSRAGG